MRYLRGVMPYLSPQTSARRRWPERRAVLVAVLLLLSLVPIGVLGWQLKETAGSQRETAEGVLQDYAKLAASEFKLRTLTSFQYRVLYPAHSKLRNHLASGGRLPRREDLSPERNPDNAAAYAVVRSFFRYNFGLDRLSVVEYGYDEAEKSGLKRSIRGGLDQETDDSELRVRIEKHGKRYQMIFYGLEQDDEGRPRSAFGCHAHWSGFVDMLREAFEREPLLPGPLALRLEGSDVSIRVRGPDGDIIYGSARGLGNAVCAEEAFGAELAGLSIEAAIDAKAAEALVIGGLPQSRYWGSVALFLASLGLATAAYVLLRREIELSRTRTEFVANVSHELRTPITQIRLFAETLLLGRVRSKREARRSLEIIDQEARRLTHRVENVLQLSRSERRSFALEPEELDLDPLIQETLEGFRPLAKAQSVDLLYEEQGETLAEIDPEAFRQILTNLLDNAVKYGPNGQTVKIGLLPDQDRICIQVDDEGPGIPRADATRIFSKYYRGQLAGQRAVDGTGIGLFIVKQLVELSGGSIRALRRKPVGTRFQFEIPRRMAGAS